MRRVLADELTAPFARDLFMIHVEILLWRHGVVSL